MILQTENEVRDFLKSEIVRPLPPFKNILMVSPDFYDIQYAINPHMLDSSGKLNKPNRQTAREQWNVLKKTFESIGLTVHVLEGQAGLYDMVYAANQSFVWWDFTKQRTQVLLGHMRSENRRPEVAHFKDWYQKNRFDIFELEASAPFEGNGDALLHPGLGCILGGIGPRTDREAYEELARRFDLNIVPFELTTQDFYHLDTCVSVLSKTTVAYFPEALSERSQKHLRLLFPNCIEVEKEESLRKFACNCFSPDGKHVVLEQGAKNFTQQLKSNGFTPIEVDTSEFIKGGGSVFCLKMALF